MEKHEKSAVKLRDGNTDKVEKSSDREKEKEKSLENVSKASDKPPPLKQAIEKVKGSENKLNPKNSDRSEKKKSTERTESKGDSKSVTVKSTAHSGFGGPGSASSKTAHKKGRQTNNSLSSVIDTGVLNQIENGMGKFRRTTSISATSDEVRLGMYKILEQIKNHPDAWPFLDPVDEDFAPDYYTKISQPMDLEKMEQRVSTKYYRTVDEFVADFDLIIDNCKKYNGKESGKLN